MDGGNARRYRMSLDRSILPLSFMRNADANVPLRHGFAPLHGKRCRVLVLGSMPGQQSLDEHRYYAHPRNAFWPIMLAIAAGRREPLADSGELTYPHRVDRVTAAGYAVWDVLACCHRSGSLDSAIVRGSEVANDILGFVDRFPELECIAFNGKTAERLFRRCILGRGDAHKRLDHLELTGLPSTSPALASMTVGQKCQRWCDALLPS